MTTTASEAGAFPVRQATRADLLEVFRIEQQSFPQPWPFAAFERFLGQPGFLVAEAAGSADGRSEVVGYVVSDTVPNHGRPLGHVKDIAVRPDCRGQGLGSLLLEQALTVMASVDAASVKLEVRESNDPAIDLYRRHGFVHRRTVPRYYDDGESALIMVRDL
ncbi:ribosomal protein S18-alanine N-acetyltransferase [Halorarius litoreus]|uniref:ribosomal protein S18-alanine N-acetyltransferase n=1 Tax=Halorarius litoreus TaxID=2962676 RepID=UPI0020CFD342|nr:ribosomal protein S18-alanine N-acetyltransferase [Halorarius litoreus]